MQHSIIIRALKGMFIFIKKYYRFSCTRKIINDFSNTIRRFFANSFIYSLFVNENRNSQNYIKHSLVGRSEGLFQSLVSFLNPFYKKGVQGSLVLKRHAKVNNRKGFTQKLVSLIIIGAVLSYNLFSVVNRSFYLAQIYISALVLVVTISLYFIDINRVYENSLMKRIFDGIFHI